MSDKPRFTVVVPVFNSADTIGELISRIDATMQPFAPFEIIAVDDLSTDDSWRAMKAAKAERQHIRLLRFTRNFGQAAALICGLRMAKAPYCITIDDDLQYAPEEIPKLIEAFHPDRHYTVFGVAPKSHRGLTGQASLLADRLIHWLAFRQRMGALRFSSFRITAVKQPDRNSYNESALRNLFAFFTMVSPRLMASVEVNRSPRKKGRSGYSTLKRIGLLLQLVATLTQLPQRLLMVMAALLALAALVLVLWPGFHAHLLPLAWASAAVLCAALAIVLAQVRRIYLLHHGAEVYAIWQEA